MFQNIFYKNLIIIIFLLLTLVILNHDIKAQEPIHRAKELSQYYESKIGLWYTVWWDSEERDPVYYNHHWIKETRVRPVRHGYYATDDPQKLQDDFRFFRRIGIDYLILDDTNDHYNDGGNIASHIDACFASAHELGKNAPKLCFAGGRPLIGGNINRMQAESDVRDSEFDSMFDRMCQRTRKATRKLLRTYTKIMETNPEAFGRGEIKTDKMRFGSLTERPDETTLAQMEREEMPYTLLPLLTLKDE